MKLTMCFSEFKEMVKRTHALFRKSPGSLFLRFDVEGAEVTITGISRELNIIMGFDADVSSVESFLIPFETLCQVIMKSEGNEISITHESHSVLFEWEGSRLRIPDLVLSVASVMEKLDDPDVSMNVNSRELYDGVRFCAHALPDKDQQVPSVLSGMFIELLDETIRISSTDTRRITVYGPEDRVVSSMTAPGLAAGVSAEYLEGTVNLKKKDNSYEISDRMMTIRGRSHTGKYPDLTGFFHLYSTMEFSCGREELIRNVIITSYCHPYVTLSVFKESLILSSEPENGGMSVDIRMPCISEGETEFCINGRYLLDALRTSKEETVRIRCSEPLKPIMVCGENCFEVILPVNRTKNME